MNRFFTLIVAGIVFIVFSSFLKIFQNGVTIKMNMPDVIEAGSEITINVTINKGKVTGIVQFRQDLPYGFTARAVNSANANFSFQDQQVRLTWFQAPADDEIMFSYKIVANERLTGNIDLGGRFSYIENNEKRSVNQQPMLLAINPSPNLNPAMRVDVFEYEKIASIESIAASSGQTVALRQKPIWIENEKVFLVTLLVNKDAVQKFAKIEETIPQGYVAASTDSKGGIFTFADQTAKFMWMDLPPEPYFIVTYKLIPEKSVTPATTVHLAGVFSYMINERTFSSEIIERQETLANLNVAQVNALLSGITIQPTLQPILIAETTTSRPAPSTSTTPTTSQSVALTTPTTSQPAVSSTPTPSQSVASSTSTTPPKTTPASSTTPGRTTVEKNDDDMLRPEKGVYYRVQVAAGRKPVNTQRYFRSYRLQYSVTKEAHDGWFKYTIGSFAEYKDARDYRVQLSNTTTIKDAFVAAYNNGNRITVQEALMTLNQKWIK